MSAGDLYLAGFWLGSAGLLLMAVMGFSHGTAGHGHGGKIGGPSHARGQAGLRSGGNGAKATVRPSFWTLLSPRVLFSLALGFGATGYLSQGLLRPWLILPVAVAGAWVFERALVQPIWNMLFRFASNPARLLDCAVLEEAVAVTNFDGSGHGVVSLELDGQVLQLLAKLPADRDSFGSRIRAGDPLTVVAVDAAHLSCTVARRA